MWQRRFLPPIGSLMAFEAVVRLGSVTLAAAELNLTQSAVSRVLIGLEETLGVTLFLRESRRMIPTEAARAYHRDVARALDILQRASLTVISNPEGGMISLAVLPTFASRWLGPRLPDFLNAHPGISLNMASRIGPVDFAGEAFDAAIRFGAGDWGALGHIKLMDERVTACVSPAFAARNRLDTLDALAGHPRLHLTSRPEAWDDWFAHQGGTPPATGGMLMDQFSMMIQAAISGLGVALLPEYLARIEISEGRLVPVLAEAVPVRGAYWLVWPRERDDDPALRALRDWLERVSDV